MVVVACGGCGDTWWLWWHVVVVVSRDVCGGTKWEVVRRG